MMKLYRSALMAGLVALGVAACGDNVEVIQPTPPAVPPPPPVEAMMAPASATVAVGGSVVFAVNASGGVAGEAATWTCASSNTGIATVSSTSAGCQPKFNEAFSKLFIVSRLRAHKSACGTTFRVSFG